MQQPEPLIIACAVFPFVSAVLDAATPVVIHCDKDTQTDFVEPIATHRRETSDTDSVGSSVSPTRFQKDRMCWLVCCGQYPCTLGFMKKGKYSGNVHCVLVCLSMFVLQGSWQGLPVWIYRTASHTCGRFLGKCSRCIGC
jgi:hypothetical protein